MKVKKTANRFCLILMLSFILTACPKGECTKYFTITGTITDSNGSPISSAEVYFTDHYGTTLKVATTDSDGKYSYEVGKYVGLGNGYMSFKKAGFQDVTTENNPLGDGTDCSDQNLVRDAEMSP